MITRWLERLHCLHHDPTNRKTFINSTWSHRAPNRTVHYYRCDRCGHTWREA